LDLAKRTWSMYFFYYVTWQYFDIFNTIHHFVNIITGIFTYESPNPVLMRSGDHADVFWILFWTFEQEHHDIYHLTISEISLYSFNDIAGSKSFVHYGFFFCLAATDIIALVLFFSLFFYNILTVNFCHSFLGDNGAGNSLLVYHCYLKTSELFGTIIVLSNLHSIIEKMNYNGIIMSSN
jgi:hypothetical protein